MSEAPKKGNLVLQIAGRALAKMDVVGKSDPYLKIYRIVDGKRELIHKTEIIKVTLDPIWEPISIPSEKLGKLDPADTLVFECWDWDKASADDLIGETSMTLGALMDPEMPLVLDLINKDKVGKKDYKNSGVLAFTKHEFVPEA